MQPFTCLEDTWVFPTGHFVETLKQEQLEEKRISRDGTQGRWAQQDCTHHLWEGTRSRLCLGCWKWFWLCKDQELAGSHNFKSLSTYLLHHHIIDRFAKFLYQVCTLNPTVVCLMSCIYGTFGCLWLLQVSATFAASLVTSPAIGAYLSAWYGDNLVVLLATLIALADICFILLAVPESLPDKMRLNTWGAPISWEQADPFAVSWYISLATSNTVTMIENDLFCSSLWGRLVKTQQSCSSVSPCSYPTCRRLASTPASSSTWDRWCTWWLEEAHLYSVTIIHLLFWFQSSDVTSHTL